jgi:c-di-GMP-binding flagellar brake protein YcgR
MRARRQRARKRRHLFYYLKVFDGLTGRLVGHLVDLSPAGMLLLVHDPLTIGTDYRLRVQLPEECGDHHDLVVDARSVSCRRDDNADRWGVSFRLGDVPRSDRAILQSMIYKFEFGN